MGGKGSGRPPSADSLIRSQQVEPKQPIADDFFIPNYSGLQAVKKTDPSVGAGVEVDPLSGSIPLNQITNPTASKTFNLGNNKFLTFTSVDRTPIAGEGIFNWECSGNFTGDLCHMHQHTGNAGAGTILLNIEAEDSDIIPLQISGSHAAGIDLTTSKIVNLVDPTANQEAATKKYVDDEDAAADAHITADGSSHANVAANTADIVSLSGSYAITSGSQVYLSGTQVILSGTQAILSGSVIANTADIVSLSGSYAITSGSQVYLSGTQAILSGTQALLSASVIANTADIVSLSGSYAITSGSQVYLSGTQAILSGTQAILSASQIILSGSFADLSGSATTHMADTTDPHGVILTQANVISSGTLSASTALTTTDDDASGSEVFRNILIGVEDSPGAASAYTQGTVYLQYTA